MTPLAIQMLLHFHSKPTKYPGIENDAQQACLSEFLRDDLINPGQLDQGNFDEPIRLTDRGQAYVNMLCSMPLPELVSHWALPGPWAPAIPEDSAS